MALKLINGTHAIPDAEFKTEIKTFLHLNKKMFTLPMLVKNKHLLKENKIDLLDSKYTRANNKYSQDIAGVWLEATIDYPKDIPVVILVQRTETNKTNHVKVDTMWLKMFDGCSVRDLRFRLSEHEDNTYPVAIISGQFEVMTDKEVASLDLSDIMYFNNLSKGYNPELLSKDITINTIKQGTSNVETSEQTIIDEEDSSKVTRIKVTKRKRSVTIDDEV